MDLRSTLFVLFSLLCQALSQDTDNSTDDGSFPYDPVLVHRPNFAQSLPVQLLLLGIVLTLTTVLIIHLIFTGQYHWPLAPVNYVLQVSAATTLLISCVATMQVVLSSTVDQSMKWPYMLDYIAVDIPPLDDNSGWEMGELAAWLLMNATTSGLIQITHIQFLTLLFPSGLERRLIFSLLGPLAIVCSIMHVLRIHDDPQLVKVASAVQNVCNATLSLLFTVSLFLWGCLVNRRDAWRTDGGTAAFGAGALTLAIISTALTFLYIPRRDQYPWMPGLMWAVVLWQSFLGWWWWVGAGMGVGEVEELLRREEKRQEKRRLKLAKRKVRKERAQTFWKGMTGAFCTGRQPEQDLQRSPASDGSDSSDSGSGSERRQGGDVGSDGETVRRVVSHQTDTSSRSGTTTSGGAISHFFNQHSAGRFLYGWYLGLRHAHLAAAREQAVERVERINQAYGPDAQEGGQTVFGWGLGSFGIRRQQRRQRQQAQAQAQAEYEMDQFDSDEDDLREPWQQRPPVVGGDAEASFPAGVETQARRRVTRPPTRTATLDEDSHRPSSVWWWGPLQRWRLQDSTDYRS
ncbi:hypothetical protein L226DRAFT_554292 [Lentinus tigrinus ALCF2SS1-7]|uniref:PalH-domain-containing protein n=1 Tax=Lentinus tigrinus ALCF2SS1-6 TaxID=1328759 RepID=A0A5C2S2A7_9APHY|nr:hypothetical protein L227DRAFT_655252 [Lentinus tigrinus ALCF2SS1-6]RPD71951.1 hypothetical protein L226DRAFT_554292 [Lentinus tigrinus ALCF2SS1-7]